MLERHPEELRLESEYSSLEAQLHELLHELFVLQHDTLRDITTLYAQYFAQAEQELQHATLEHAEMQRRLELFSVRKAKGHSLDTELIRFVNDMVSREFYVYHESLRRNFDSDPTERNARQDYAPRSKSTAASKELRNLYHELVRRLHPDLNAEQQHFEKFWLMVRTAYEQQDLPRLRGLHNLLCRDDQSMTLESDEQSRLDTLRERNRRLHMRIDYEQRKLDRIKREEPFSLQAMLSSQEARSAHESSITKQIDKMRRSSKAVAEHLKSMLGDDWDAKSPEQSPDKTRAEDAMNFQEEFRMNTYFSMRA